MLLTVVVVVVVAAAMGVVAHAICDSWCVHRIRYFGRVFKGGD